MLKNAPQAGIQKPEESRKRSVYAPRPERGTESPAVVSVVLDEDEDVEWTWTHTADGKSVVTGYIISKSPDKPRQQGAVSDDSNRTVPSGG
jgi:hypothetical protein